jgi:hypothetical protein
VIDGIRINHNHTKRLANGEAGLEYLIIPLKAIEFETDSAATTFVQDLFKRTHRRLYDTAKVAGMLPVVKINRRYGKRIQGSYTRHTRELQLAPHLRLTVIVHELGHYVEWLRDDKGGHGKAFKAIFKRMLTAIYDTFLGWPVPRKKTALQAQGIRMPRIGAKVKVDGGKRLGNFNARVIMIMRVKCKVMDERGRMWNCGPDILTPIEE